MRGVVPVALLVGLLLSGCVSEDDPQDAAVEETANEADFTPANDDTATSDDPAAAADDNTTTSEDANAAPTLGGFEANVTGLNVLFTFNATDADGDDLTYTLSLGNQTNATGALVNGTGNVTHTFTEGGSYNVTLTISDGTLSANQTLTLNLTADAPKGSQSFSASWLVGAPGCALILTGPGNALDGVTGAFRNLDAATWGTTFLITFAAKPDSVGYEYAFYKGSTRVGVVAASGSPPTSTGTVPDDVTGIAFRNCGGAGTSVTYSAA